MGELATAMHDTRAFSEVTLGGSSANEDDPMYVADLFADATSDASANDGAPIHVADMIMDRACKTPDEVNQLWVGRGCDPVGPAIGLAHAIQHTPPVVSSMDSSGPNCPAWLKRKPPWLSDIVASTVKRKLGGKWEVLRRRMILC